MAEIIIHDSSDNPNRRPEMVDGGAKHLRILFLRRGGGIEEIFTGTAFSEKKWKKKMKKWNRTSYLDEISPKPR
ncbi:MAG: hypothetical protein ACOZAL_01115 [Patescibacteria group bacterium]